jgi:hypothetical protein
VRVEGKETLLIEEVLRNASLPIDVTPSGIVTEVSPVAVKNALSPIEVRVEGKVTLLSDKVLRNESSPIDVTPSGIMTEVRVEL